MVTTLPGFVLRTILAGLPILLLTPWNLPEAIGLSKGIGHAIDNG